MRAYFNETGFINKCKKNKYMQYFNQFKIVSKTVVLTITAYCTGQWFTADERDQTS